MLYFVDYFRGEKTEPLNCVTSLPVPLLFSNIPLYIYALFLQWRLFALLFHSPANSSPYRPSYSLLNLSLSCSRRRFEPDSRSQSQAPQRSHFGRRVSSSDPPAPSTLSAFPSTHSTIKPASQQRNEQPTYMNKWHRHILEEHLALDVSCCSLFSEFGTFICTSSWIKVNYLKDGTTFVWFQLHFNRMTQKHSCRIQFLNVA